METKTNNIACRIFKEQIELIQQLPENERAEVLYKAIISAVNQFDNQIENQNENAYVSVSDSVSVLSKTVFSLLKKNIVCKEFSNNYGGKRIGAGKKKQTDLAGCKDRQRKMSTSEQCPQSQQCQQCQNHDSVTDTVIEKKDNSNKGGMGEKEKEENKPVRGAFIPPTLEELLVYAKNMNDHRGVGGFMCSKDMVIEFFDHYNRQGWMLGNGIHMTNWQSALKKWCTENIKKIMER